MNATTIVWIFVLVGGVLAVLHHLYFRDQLGRWAWVPAAGLSLVFVGFEIVGERPSGSMSSYLWFAFLAGLSAYYEHRLWKVRQRSGGE